MAVLERSYKRFQGPLTPAWSRFLIIPRHAYRDVFRSKLFTTFFLVCFLPLLVEAVRIYLHHNHRGPGNPSSSGEKLTADRRHVLRGVCRIQGGFAFLITWLVGPPL